MKKTLLLVCFLGFLQTYSQELKVKTSEKKTFKSSIEEAKRNSPDGIVRCATHEHNKLRQANNQTISDEKFEQWITSKIKDIKKQRKERRLPSVIRIPVVVHVIHNGDAIGVNENISDGQVLSQITVLNQDFRRLAGTPGFGAGVDTSIEFCLAQVDPNGNPTNGINRVNLGIDAFDEATVEGTLKPNTIWDPTKYFNMWTANFTGDLDGVLGYAQFPTGSGLAGMPTENCIAGEASTDGLIMAYHTFGSRTLYPSGNYGGTAYDKGRTATHEIGHMFGLRHIWGDATCGDDYCADTPTAHKANSGCPTVVNCDGTGNEMVENYMDYTNDACMNIFTQDQKDRMLAVLMNSPRRDDLLVSNVCSSPQASIQFKRTACETRLINASIQEGNGCGYTEYTIPLNINKAPTANAIVTFAIDATSVADNNDVTIMTPSVTFNSKSKTDKNLIIRVLNDGIVEQDEEIVINFIVNANGGDAFANPEGNKFKMKILNDDIISTPTPTTTLLNENFENPIGWFLLDGDNDGLDWGLIDGDGLGTAPNKIVGTCVYSEKDLSILGTGNGKATPNNFIISPQITIPSVVNSATLSYIIGSYNKTAGNYVVYFTEDVSSVATITSGTILQNLAEVQADITQLKTHDLSSLAGKIGYIVFRHADSKTATGLLLLDSVKIEVNTTTIVQTDLNAPTQHQSNISGTGTTYTKDSNTYKVMVDITNDTNFNYGCTTVAVSRDLATAGAPAVNYGANTANNLKVMAKTFTITPTNNTTSGNATLKFYFTEAEVKDWETATGNSRTALRVIKEGDVSALSTTLSTFGTNTTLTANVANGIGGVYYFGIQNTLDTSDFEFDNFSLYPNPNKGNFTVKFDPETNDKININVYDLRGRQIFEQSYTNNGAFNQEVNLDRASSGMHLITISTDQKKTTKRIVIE